MTTLGTSQSGSRMRLRQPEFDTLDDNELEGLLDELAPLVQQDSEAASGRLAALAVEAERRHLADLEANAVYLRARAEVNLGNLDIALDLIDRARRVWAEAGDLMSAWRTDLGRMHVLDDLGNHAEAIAVGEALAAIVSASEVDPGDAGQAAWLRAAALENVGVGRGYLGDHASALEAYTAAEATYLELGLDEDVPRPMANRGVEMIELGRYGEAIVALRQAGEGFLAHDDRLSAAKCLAFEARAHQRAGDHLSSAAAIQRASEYLEGQTVATEYARTQLVRAETLVSLNLLEEAAELYDEIVPRFAESGLQHDLADARLGRATALRRLGRHDEALAELHDAEEIYVGMEATLMAAVARLAESELVADDAALALVDEAIAVFRATDRTVELAAGLVRRANLASDRGVAESALAEAMDLLDRVEVPRVRWRALHERSRRLTEAGDTDGALEALQEALDVVEGLRSTVTTEEQRLFFMADRSFVHEDLIALHLATGDVDAAYEAAERARARTLGERLQGELAPTAATPPTAELNAIYTDLLVGVAPKELRRAARRLERALPRVAVAFGTGKQPNLDDGTVGERPTAISYQRLGDEIAAFVDDGSVTVVRNLASVAEIQSLLAQLDAQWRRFEVPGLAVRQHAHLMAVARDILQRLHVRLLSPLPIRSDAGELLVMPTEPLSNVPFAALHDGAAFVAEHTTVTMAPSRTVALHAQEQRRGRTARRLLVGVADEHAPLVADEIGQIAEVVEHATVLLDSDASVTRVRELAPEHDVIHIACHGVHRPDSPQFSALRLGDRWLTAAEVAGFGLAGQLVVLSACSSGRQLGAGTADELVGLPRSFLAAGASSVIVNLWQVHDASSRSLMTALHRALTSLDPPVALRRAQLELMRDFPHPYHWAPAVVFGAPPEKELS